MIHQPELRSFEGWFPYKKTRFQGSGEQWGRDKIYPDWWSHWCCFSNNLAKKLKKLQNFRKFGFLWCVVEVIFPTSILLVGVYPMAYPTAYHVWTCLRRHPGRPKGRCRMPAEWMWSSALTICTSMPFTVPWSEEKWWKMLKNAPWMHAKARKILK